MAGKKVIYDLLTELRALASQPVGSENGSGIACGPTGWIKGVVTVTVAGSTSLEVYLEGSDDDSTYYRIPGTDFRDPTDGELIDAVGQYEVAFKTDFAYVRCVSAVLGSAFTHQVILSKLV